MASGGESSGSPELHPFSVLMQAADISAAAASTSRAFEAAGTEPFAAAELGQDSEHGHEHSHISYQDVCNVANRHAAVHNAEPSPMLT